MPDERMIDVDEDIFSDESSFYGDGETKAGLEDDVAAFSISEWSERRHNDLNATKALNLKNGWSQESDVWRKTAKLYNPGEGQPAYRQLTESVSEFLERLPPQTTPVDQTDGWIWICDPYRSRPEVEGRNWEHDLSTYKEQGSQILRDLKTKREQLEMEGPGEAKGTVTRKLKPFRDECVTKIYKTATDLGITSGKWMLFPYVDDVHKVWWKVAEATADALLGPTSKVAPLEEAEAMSDGRSAKPRLICVYTKDFNDKEDVGAVLGQLIKMRLVKPGQAIFYKADALTHLAINSGNEWGIPASMYSTWDFRDKARDTASEAKG